MNLNLDVNKKAEHYKIAVAGSYSDSFIEVQSASPTSASSDVYVRWVPRTKGSYTGGISNVSDTYMDSDSGSSEGAGHGYLKWTAGSTPYPTFHILRFRYYDDSNANPGLELENIGSFTTYYTANGANDLADEISDLHNQSVYNYDIVYVIVTQNNTHSSSTLYSQMLNTAHSWRWARVLGATTSTTSYSYCAVGTNINSIGLLSESLQGQASGHINAASEIVIEHSKATIGHAGYGEELSSGVGAGTNTNTTASSTTTLSKTTTVTSGTNALHHNGTAGEHVRITALADVQQYAVAFGGKLDIEVTDQSGSGVTITTNKTGLHKVEGTFETKSGQSSLSVSANLYTGSGTGAGTSGHNGVTIRNLEAFKCGFNPDASRDVAVSGNHMSGLNVQEGIAGFDLRDPEAFYTFWNSDRNMVPQSKTYTMSTQGSSSSGIPYTTVNYQYRNGRNTSGYGFTGHAAFDDINWCRWFHRDFGSLGLNVTSDTYAQFGVWEAHAAPSNHTQYFPFYQNNGIEVDPSKLYLSGVWVRVRYQTNTNTALSPNAIAMTGSSANSSGNATNQYTYQGTGSTEANHFELERVQYQTYSGETNEWRLLSGFYLPYDWSSTQVTNWYNSYYANYAGEYHFSGGASAHYPNTTYGINASGVVNGRVAQMDSKTAYVRPQLKAEIYSGTAMWLEYAYPFMLELDPMNITSNGDVFFWDFEEI